MQNNPIKRSVGVRYCGGCNPRFDRVAFVRRLEALTPEVHFETLRPGEPCDAALVVCGCKTRCANISDIAATPSHIFCVSAFEDLLPTRDRLKNLPVANQPITLTKTEVMAILPHKSPMLFIDAVPSLIPGEEITAEFMADAELVLFAGHFPEHPVFPGTLLIEAMAQASGLMLLTTEQYWGKLPFLRGVGKANFWRPVPPGTRLGIHGALLADKPEMGASICKGQVFIAGSLAADAEIILSMR